MPRRRAVGNRQRIPSSRVSVTLHLGRGCRVQDSTSAGLDDGGPKESSAVVACRYPWPVHGAISSFQQRRSMHSSSPASLTRESRLAGPGRH
ncbi:hypothetical protein E4U55_005404 [Claviceps digitariae]|nr:hypothetical protein E4U55_005404 [Claviceps digitariae]